MWCAGYDSYSEKSGNMTSQGEGEKTSFHSFSVSRLSDSLGERLALRSDSGTSESEKESSDSISSNNLLSDLGKWSCTLNGS